MKRKVLLVVLLVAGMFTLSCNRTKTGGGPPKFADCDQDVEVQWAGKDVCAQQADSNHYNNSGVKISADKCKGIHLTDPKDFRVDVLLRKENTTSTCPLQPFETAFPAKSKDGHVHTGRVHDRAAIGCEYEVHLKELGNTGSCDPHIDITDGGTP